jgi:hypothetical protein
MNRSFSLHGPRMILEEVVCIQTLISTLPVILTGIQATIFKTDEAHV